MMPSESMVGKEGSSGASSMNSSGTAAMAIARPYSFMPSVGVQGAASKVVRSVRGRSVSSMAVWMLMRKKERFTIETEA